MSQPKRYFFIGDLLPGQTRYPHHHFVLYDDYAALAAENERLRKAGDRLHDALVLMHKYGAELHPSIWAWDAAKEGGDAK